MLRIQPNANQEMSNLDTIFDSKKHEKLKKIRKKSKKSWIDKKRAVETNFHDFWLIFAPFGGQNQPETDKNGVAFLGQKK